MSDLRDQFAIQILNGLLSNAGGPVQQCGMRGWGPTNCDFNDVVSLAYEIADAMIAEREKDDVETKDRIKQMLVDAINKEHPGLNTSTVCTAEHLIFQLTTGKPF